MMSFYRPAHAELNQQDPQVPAVDGIDSMDVMFSGTYFYNQTILGLIPHNRVGQVIGFIICSAVDDRGEKRLD